MSRSQNVSTGEAHKHSPSVYILLEGHQIFMSLERASSVLKFSKFKKKI